MFAVWPAFGTIANVVEAVEVPVTENTAYGALEATATLPSFEIPKKEEEALWVFVNIPKE